MSNNFVGITKELIESEVGGPIKVAVEFAIDTDDVAAGKLFLDKINELKDKVNKEIESKEYVFWLGGDYEDLGTFSNKADADRGIAPTERMTDLLHEFKGKKVKLKIEVIEE